MITRTGSIALSASLLLVGCSTPQADDPAAPRPQQAGQQMDPVRTAIHMAGARLAAISGDQQGVQRNINAMSEDMRRAMKLADASRPIDRESARSIARSMPRVRSANWIDRNNLLVRVEGAERRSQQTIDDLCIRLESLGDTLAVVVHLQNAAAVTRDQMDTLSRNCQLAMGDHAFLQRNRAVDALDPALRAQHRTTVEHIRGQPPQAQSAGDKEALEAMPQM